MRDKKSKITDKLLVERYQSGDSKALPLLVERWHKNFCNNAYWLLKDVDGAKDIAQDSWKTIIEKIHKLDDALSFGSWGMRIVYTKSLNLIKENNKITKALDTFHYQGSIQENDTTNERKKKELLKAIQSLPEHQQMVIKLFYTEAYSLKEIAGILKIS